MSRFYRKYGWLSEETIRTIFLISYYEKWISYAVLSLFATAKELVSAGKKKQHYCFDNLLMLFESEQSF